MSCLSAWKQHKNRKPIGQSNYSELEQINSELNTNLERESSELANLQSNYSQLEQINSELNTNLERESSELAKLQPNYSQLEQINSELNTIDNWNRRVKKFTN
ncbi:hypothetical protein P9112_006057 [Eukaryota sp. TZLM1-RC]